MATWKKNNEKKSCIQWIINIKWSQFNILLIEGKLVSLFQVLVLQDSQNIRQVRR